MFQEVGFPMKQEQCKYLGYSPQIPSWQTQSLLVDTFSPPKSLLVLLLPLFPEMLCLSAPIDYGKTELPLGLVSVCFSLNPIPLISGSASAWYVCSVLPEVFVSLLIKPLCVFAELNHKTRNSWVKNANRDSFCDSILFYPTTVGHKQIFQPCS